MTLRSAFAATIVTLYSMTALASESWGVAGPELGASVAMMALGSAVFLAGIPLFFHGLHGSRRLFGTTERMGMGAMLRLGQALSNSTRSVQDEANGYQGYVDQMERGWNVQRSRRLELAGWISYGIGGLGYFTGVGLLGSFGLAGMATLLSSMFPMLIGLPMGIVGTVRRVRAERELQIEDAEVMATDPMMLGLNEAPEMRF